MPARSSRIPACLAALAFLSVGCGSGGIAPNRDGTLPLLNSPEIATGAWTIAGASSLTSTTASLPIGGLFGALTADGTTVAGYFNIASSDGPSTYQPSTCLIYQGRPYGIGISTIFVHGHASAGSLVLDGSFGASQIHIAAQLAADRKSFVSGSYQVTRACQTDAPQISGAWNPPLTGTFAGPANSANGSSYHALAQLVQGSSINAFGEIPVDGTIALTGAGCDVTLHLWGAAVEGSLGSFDSYTAPGLGDNAGMYTEEVAQSNTLTLDNWGFNDPTCGSVSSSAQNPGQLVRQ